MADSPNSNKKEMSMEMRLLLALLLTVPVMFLSQYLFPAPAKPPAKKAVTTTESPAPPAAASPEATKPPDQTAEETAPMPGATAQQQLPNVRIDNGRFEISMSNQGATIRSWMLPAFKGNDGKPLQLLNTSREIVLTYANEQQAAAAKQSAESGKWPSDWLPAELNGATIRIVDSHYNDQRSNDDLARLFSNPKPTGTAVNAAPPVFSLYFPSLGQAQRDSLEKTVNWAYYKPTVDPDGLGVTYDFSNGHVAVKKSLRFEKNSYLAHVTTEVTEDGKPVPHMIEWRGGFGDLTLAVPSATEHTAYFNVADNKLIEKTAKDATSGPVSASGTFSFAGVTDTYFAAVFLPKSEGSMQVATFGDMAPTPLEAKAYELSGVGVQDGDSNDFRLFVGPKDVDMIKRIDPKLEQLVDFGWMSILAKPLFYAVNYVDHAFVHNFGWAIIVVTILLNMVLLPLRFSSMKSMRKMQALKPQIDAINNKYKGISMRDPKAADKTQETMDLYKRHGVNPMGGCVPMAIQFPILIAFYKVFAVSVEMRGASWLWVTDLSQPEHLPIHILPIVMVGSQFLMQKMMPQPGAGDASQQAMTKFMPLIFGFMFYKLSSGLVLYYLTSNLVNMAQQWFFNRTDTARAAALSVQPPPSTKKKKK